MYAPNNAQASVLSFLRPNANNATLETAKGFYKWLANARYSSVGHIADVDLENYANIRSAKLLILAGHSEYWTRLGRENFDQFVAAGGNVLILSGNTMWWQVRYSVDQTQLICYKNNLDPTTDPKLATTLFNTLPLPHKYPTIQSVGADFDYGGYGLASDNGWDGLKVVNANSLLFEGTGLKNGDIISMPASEYDGAPLLGYTAAGIPIIDKNKLRFSQIDLVGYDFGYRSRKTTATWIVFKKTTTSGIVINGASLGWGSEKNIDGVSGAAIKRLFANMIDLLLRNVYPV